MKPGPTLEHALESAHGTTREPSHQTTETAVIIILANLKGGVGKSSTNVLMAAECWTRGWDYRLIDLDPQGTSSSWLGGDYAVHLPRPTIAEIRGFDAPGRLVFVDPPAGEAPGTGIGLEAADKVVAVTGPSWVELRTLPKLEEIVDLDGVILTRYDRRLITHREALIRLERRYEKNLFGVIPQRTEVEQAAAANVPPSPLSDVGIAASAVLDRMESWRN